ncbi:MAG: DUF1080 domain-containing protein [Candidatus Symbiothrix sp.]|jgi:hypothetical protein|nr:DUF1080 domain-containing protein [Candidatus Symbiothrix sp.]
MKKLLSLLPALLLMACSGNDGYKTIYTNDHSQWNLTGNVQQSKEEITLTGTDARAVTTDSYKNFVLEFECKTAPGAIGAVSFHSNGANHPDTGYEVLVNNNEAPAEWRKTGSLSTIRNFGKCLVPNDTWFPVKIEVNDINIRVYVDSLWIVDYYQPDHPYRLPEYSERVLSEGVFVFSNYSEAPVAFRNIRVKDLFGNFFDREDIVDETHDDIIRLQQQNFPTIDEHLHLKGGLTAENVAELTRKYGITYGIAPNCGKNFPITTDGEIYTWLDSMKHHPFLLPMQAEGREWLDMFSLDAIRKFDYVFTDAMTWTDDKGRRLRIWIPEETYVDDKQHFMDLLVERAYGIITTEPIHIYVNPTYLPDELKPEYDMLWTNERMEKIIDACVSKGVAIEINNRFKIPSQTFIRLAKDRGAKFTIGTNNEGIQDVGKLEYAIEMIKACGITKEDMWIPTGKNY